MSTTILKAPAGRTGQVQTEYGNYSIGSDGQVTVDSRVVDDLLGAGFTMVDAVTQASGSHTVTAGEATANAVEIDTGLTTITAVSVTCLRANIVTNEGMDIQITDSVITLAENGVTWVVTEDDVIQWIATGSVEEE